MSKHPLRGRQRALICYSLYPLGFFLGSWGLFAPLPGNGVIAMAGAAIIAFVTAFCLLDIYRQLDRLNRDSIRPTSTEEPQ